MANRIFFFISVPLTIICFITYSLVVFTPKYIVNKGHVKEGVTTVENKKMGLIQMCVQKGNVSSSTASTTAKQTTAKKVRLEEMTGEEELASIDYEVGGGTLKEASADDADTGVADAAEAKSADEDSASINAVAKESVSATASKDESDLAAEETDAEAETAEKAEDKKDHDEKKQSFGSKVKHTFNVVVSKLQPPDAKGVTWGKYKCGFNDWKLLTNQVFLAFLSCASVAWFILLAAVILSLIKIILDWVPHDKIKAARILCSRNFGLGLMSAHISAGGFIIASMACMIFLWKWKYASLGWVIGINIYFAGAIALLSFITAIMWFMDVKKMGLVPV